ncbi:hypothetical protein Dimus_022318 [Dionaea muscipula]
MAVAASRGTKGTGATTPQFNELFFSNSGTKAKEDLVAATHAVEPFGLRVEVRMALVSRAGRQLQRYNPNGHRLVVGCIPYRYKSDSEE